MTLAEPVSVLLESGVLATFEKADGSGDPVETRGILEDAETERQSGQTTREQDAWYLTAATADVAAFVEGDTVTIGADEYTILDKTAKDSSLIVFLLTLD